MLGLLLSALPLLAACAREEPQAEAPLPALRIEQTRGPVHFLAELTPDRLLLSDEATLRIRIEAREGVEIVEPEFDEALSSFDIAELRREPVAPRPGTVLLERTLRLEPADVGSLPVGPFRITFRVDGSEYLLETEPATVEVSISGGVGPEEADLAALEGPEEPLGLEDPSDETVWWWALLLVPAVLMLWWLRIRRRRRFEHQRAPTPTELAERELAALLADDPLARGELQTFYVELTLIVRRYIERTEGIRAPEMTTQEFLRSMGRRPDADALRAFLEAADLVKFAGATPDRGTLDASVERAREFVGLARAEAGSGAGSGAKAEVVS